MDLAEATEPFALRLFTEGCEKGSGTAEDPYRIYNIYHLQAMGGGLPDGVFPALALLFPATEESLRAGVATLFGEAEARTAAHYRLENDIDATQTGQTNWHEGQGFLPIGDSAFPFLGALDGTGYAIRELRINRADASGLFGVVGAGGRISNLGVDGGEVEGDSMVGLLAARVEAGGVIEGAWGRGRVRGSGNVGGLAGYLAGGATMKRSWFGGYVRGVRNVGGLVGGAEARSESADTIADSWAMAQTRAFVGVGGLAGNWESGNRMTASWAGGPLTGTSARDRFGCLASGSGESSASYSGVETSGCSVAGIGGMAVDSLQTLVAPEWSNAVWDFGGDSDFPALRNIATSDGRGRSLQAGGMIFGLTRLLRGDGTVFPSLPLDLTTSVPGEERSMLRLDVNGLAADDGSATAQLSSCRISGGAISAESNYNGARVSMLLLSSFGARLSLEDEDLCVVGIDSGAGGLATLRLSYAGAGSGSEDVLHFDYAAQLSPGLTPPSPPPPPIPPPPPPSPSPFGFADAPAGFYPVIVFSGAMAEESVLTVTVMNGSLVSFADGGFASGGGSEAALSLTESAVDLFTIDGLELSLTLEARSGEGQSATATVTFVSSALGFDGAGLSALFVATELAAGMEVFAATEAGLTIWHNRDEERYELQGTNANLFTVGADGAVSARGEIRSTELIRYELTLALLGGGVTARRALAVELMPPSPGLDVRPPPPGLDDEEVEVPALSESGYALLTVSPTNGGTVRGFANVNGFASGGGTQATISLSSDATVLFDMDGLELSLTLTASSAGGTVSSTVRVVSSALGFNGAGLRRVFSSNLEPADEVFGSSEAGLTIWHSANERESYALEGADADLFGASGAGAVTALESLPAASGDGYELTLVLRGGGVESRRDLAVELTPSLSDGGDDLSGVSGTTVTVRSNAAVGENIWALSLSGGSSLSSFEEKGLKSEGGSLALVALTSLATALFDMDGLALSLTLTLTAETGEEATGTVTFVSSAREFNGTGLSTLIVTTALAAGTEVFAATDAGLTIWHSANEDETYTLEGANANLFTVGAAGAVSVKGEIRPTELVRYELTLALTDGGVTARRALAVELTPLLLDVSEDLSELNGLRVTVEARATAGDFVWGVMPAGGSFAPFANVNGFASAGGSAAALSLATDATALFDMDELALSLTLTLTAESGEETTGTVTFVSSAREFNGTGLSTLIVTTALAAGTEVFAASAAGLTIWHSANEDETYALEGESAGLFAVGLAGAVSASGEIRPTEKVRYELTLALTDGGVTARRGLAVELTPPLLDVSEDLSELNGLRVTVEARATVGDFVWGVMPPGGSFAPFANVNGFASAGGSAAALSLSSDATALFDMDGLALSLTLTLTAESGEEATGTVTFVSSAREFNGTGLSTRIVTTALAMGTEVFAASDAGLTIWHSPNENETYTLEGTNANLFDASAAGAVSVKGEIRPTELVRYELTLALTDGGVTSRRGLTVELTPLLLDVSEDLSELSGLRVTVEARATAGDFVWGVMPPGGSFAPFADVNGFASAGGSAAALSLATDATALFDMDELALSLTLTLTAESGEETTGTVTFVSSAREFNGTGLSTLIVTTALAAGTEVFAAAESSLTIWHSPNENETYTLEGANANLFDASAAGAVSVKGEIRPTELTRYELTLALTDGELTARRGLTVELTPPLLDVSEDLSELNGLRVTVAARAKAKDFVWGVMPPGGSFAPFADVNGFASAGGSAAALSLATDATALFDMDELALSLTLTLTAESGEETTGTVTFVSSALEFNGTGLSTLIVTAALAAGTEVFAATDAGLTIWHSPNESESYTLEGANANLFDASAAGAVIVKGEIRPTELTRYELTLALSDGGVTARRGLAVELTPPLLEADEDLTQLRGLTVTVAARAKAKDFVWGVAPAAGGSFAPFANVNGFASAGGAAAALSLATDATVLFDMDELALSLTLTLTAESGEETTGTVTFVSSALEFNGTGLSTLIVTAALAAGTEVFAATDAGLTIWHSPNENEFYTLEGANANLFTVGAAGAVSVTGEIRPTEKVRYELTLALSDGGVTARRALTVELTPPLLEADGDLTQLRGLRVTVAARATVGDFVWGVMPPGGSFAPFANVNGFASAGGSAAALSLSSDAIDLFDMDELALSLTLTLTAESGEEATGDGDVCVVGA